MESNRNGNNNKTRKQPSVFQKELMRELAQISPSFYIMEAWGIVKEVERFEGFPTYYRNLA